LPPLHISMQCFSEYMIAGRADDMAVYAWINVAEDQGPGLGVALFADVSLRLVAFVILHVLIYVLSAD